MILKNAMQKGGNMNTVLLFNEIKKMCELLFKYDRSSFNAPTTTADINSFQSINKLELPDELKDIYQVANGFQVLGRTAKIYNLHEVGIKLNDIPDEYVVFGELTGDGEKICFHEKTGEIVTVYNGKIFEYSIIGFLEYCVDQCLDGFFMSKVDIAACLELRANTLEAIQKIYSLKSITIGALADKFTQSSNDEKEAFMHDLPIIIRAAVFGALDEIQCMEFMNYLKIRNNFKADNFVRGMKRRAIDNFFNRERQALDEGKASFPWNVKQMREIYNFNDEGMCYQNAGVVNVYDSFENIIQEASFNRIGERKLFDKKIGITYLYDVYTNVRYAGNMNNIKLKG